jgi:hypothetical protein
MHRAGAAGLSQLLRFPVPADEQRLIPCPCGHPAQYRELRSKPVLTAAGTVEILRPYYLCSHGHNGQFPADVELDVENTDFSPACAACKGWSGRRGPLIRDASS